MPTKDELETRLYERMSQENEAFLAEMKTQSPDEIISHAYEIACRDNLLMLFEDETSLSERQLAVLTEFEHPLSQLYTCTGQRPIPAGHPLKDLSANHSLRTGIRIYGLRGISIFFFDSFPQNIIRTARNAVTKGIHLIRIAGEPVCIKL